MRMQHHARRGLRGLQLYINLPINCVRFLQSAFDMKSIFRWPNPRWQVQIRPCAVRTVCCCHVLRHTNRHTARHSPIRGALSHAGQTRSQWYILIAGQEATARADKNALRKWRTPSIGCLTNECTATCALLHASMESGLAADVGCRAVGGWLHNHSCQYTNTATIGACSTSVPA